MSEDSDRRELFHRLRKIEASVGELTTQTALLNQAFSKIEDLETRVRSIEMDVANNKMLFNIVRWLAVTMAGSAISVMASIFLGK